MEFNLETVEFFKLKAIELAFSVGPAWVKAILFLLIGRWVVNFILRMFKKVLVKYEIDPSLSTFLTSLVSVVLWIVLLISVATTLGMEMTSFVAILGAAGLAIGLALQGSLSNFAGGVLILIFKPFRVGDTIEAQGILGSVESIDILYTKVRIFDNRVVTLPNGSLANNSIINLSAKPTRRVEFNLGVAYGTDLKKTKTIILDILNKDDRIKDEPAPVVYFTKFGDSSLDLVARCWVDSADLWPVFWDNMEIIKEAFEANDIEVPFPQRDVNHYFPEGIPEAKKIITASEGNTPSQN